MKLIEKKNWKKNWAGRWSLLECCYYGKLYTTSLRKQHGVGLKNALFTYENGNSVNFLVEDELANFGKELAKKLTENQTLASEWADGAKTQGDKALALMNSVEGREITKKDYDELWNILEKYLVVSFPVKRVADYLSQGVLEKVLPLFEKVRVYGEPVYAQSALLIKKFADQISTESGIQPEFVLCMLSDEFDIFFNTKALPPKEVLEKRYVRSLLSVDEGVCKLIDLEYAEIIEKRLLGNENVRELKGTPAFKGVVRGKAKIVFNPEAVTELEPNTVLVTGMTRPEYLHLFEQAVAVLTDAGGVLSHAAITARELKKPTIVGTEIATKVLKDGDEIEVDADNGVVRIIK